MLSHYNIWVHGNIRMPAGWDQLFGTFTNEPAAGHTGMTIGLPGFRERHHLELGYTLANPCTYLLITIPSRHPGSRESH